MSSNYTINSTVKLQKVFYTPEALSSIDFYLVANCEYNSLKYGAAEAPRQETWRTIKSYSGDKGQPGTSKRKYAERYYQVNEYGEVRIVEIADLNIYQPQVKKNKMAYPCVRVNLEGEIKTKPRPIYRLVMLAFDPTGFEKGYVIRHLSGVERNDINNLAWGSQKDNFNDRKKGYQNNPFPEVEEYKHVHSKEMKCPAIGLFVSNHGNVKQITITIPTLKNYFYTSGKRKGQKKHVSIRCSNIGSTIREDVLLHRAVYKAFTGDISPEMLICHNDGNPFNCALSNLREDTAQGNTLDKKKHKTMLSGEMHPSSKLSDEEVYLIRQKRSLGEKLNSLSCEFGVAESTISAICTREGYRVKN